MMIYQVHLAIDPAIFNDFTFWLKQHVQEMLQFEGFQVAKILSKVDPDTQHHTIKHLTVQYEIASKASLENYFAQHAARMRKKGLDAFGNRFSASREIFTLI